jgi:hypothetical protein
VTLMQPYLIATPTCFSLVSFLRLSPTFRFTTGTMARFLLESNRKFCAIVRRQGKPLKSACKRLPENSIKHKPMQRKTGPNISRS